MHVSDLIQHQVTIHLHVPYYNQIMLYEEIEFEKYSNRFLKPHIS